MEKSSLRIGAIFGIPIYLHFSFLLILPVLAYAFGQNFKDVAGLTDVNPGSLALSPYVWGLLVALALFGSVLLHELGHSFVAMRKDIRISGITLMIMGGVAQLEEMPEKPGDEAAIAVAGPLVSVGLGLGCYVLLSLVSTALHPNINFALSYLGHINLFLAAFNLIPAFPMDGGRILRAWLATRRSFVSATKTASDVGRVFAFGFGILGLVQGNLFLVMIAFFVYMGASSEYHHSLVRTTLDGFRVRDLMATSVSTVTADSSVGDLIERMLREHHHGYPVMDADRLVGCVTLEDIEKLEGAERNDARVEDIMTRDVIVVRPDDDIYVALRHFSEGEIGRVPVVEHGRLVGILSRSDLMSGLRVRRLLRT